VASIERPKARNVSASGGLCPSLPYPQPGPLLFAYCSINGASLLFHIVYYFLHLCDKVIVLIRSGKLSFHDWKSQGILLQKTCRNPEINASTALEIIHCGIRFAISTRTVTIMALFHFKP